MALPTKTEWDTLKKEDKIAKSAWWKPADAAVGPALAKVESAKAAYKSDKVYMKAEAYCVALLKLNEAFQKFLNKKDLTSAGGLKTKIEDWMKEVHTKAVQLNAKLPALEKAKPEDFKKLWDKEMGI